MDQLNSGEIFIVKALFKGYKWNRESITEQRTLGILFLSYAKTIPLKLEVIPRKTPSNQQQYKFI
jgi:hypothetical protein